MSMGTNQFFNDIERIVIEDGIENPQKIDKFNIFNILELERNEVNLHSRLLSALLSPEGTHSMGCAFLTLFLNEISETTMKFPDWDESDLNDAIIYREKDNIDILLLLPDEYTIIIENKIDALDQPRQIERYNNIVKTKYHRTNSKIFSLYLTPDRREPEKQSVGSKKNKVFSISYDSEIINWLKKCIEITTNENVISVLKQYKQTVERLTITNENEGLMNKISEYITTSKENFQLANNISEGLNCAKRDILLNFMTSLKEEFIKAGYSEEDETIYMDRDIINGYYSNKKNTGLPGMRMEIYAFNENIYLELGIEIYWELYYYFDCGQYNKKNEYSTLERRTIKRKYPDIYEQVEKVIWKEELVNSSRQTNTSIKWDFICDENGDKYNFKKFSNNCIDLIENNSLAARRIAKNLITMVNKIKKELEQ